MAEKQKKEESPQERIDRMAKEAGHGTESCGSFGTPGTTSPPEHKMGVPADKDKPPTKDADGG